MGDTRLVRRAILGSIASLTLLAAAIGAGALNGNSSRTFYIDSRSGNDGLDGLSASSAWATLWKIEAAGLQPGDKVLLAKGALFRQTIRVVDSGSASAPITIGSYGSGAMPIVTGGSSCVTLTGSNVVVQGISAIGCSWAGFEVSGANDTIKDSYASANAAAISVNPGATGAIIQGNTFTQNTKMSVLTQSPKDDDSGAFGVLLRSDYADVSHNTISGNYAFSYDYGHDGSAVEIFGGKNNHVHHNTSIDNDTFAELGSAGTANNAFYYNVVRSGNEASAFLVTRGSGNFGPVTGTSAYNNSVSLTGSGSFGFACDSCSTSILSLRNNIISVNGTVGWTSAFTFEYNLVHGEIGSLVLGVTNMNLDAHFVGTTNLHLRSTSPAIRAGKSMGTAVDADGVVVPAAVSPDIGAYQYVGATSPVTTLPPRTVPVTTQPPRTVPVTTQPPRTPPPTTVVVPLTYKTLKVNFGGPTVQEVQGCVPGYCTGHITVTNGTWMNRLGAKTNNPFIGYDRIFQDSINGLPGKPLNIHVPVTNGKWQVILYFNEIEGSRIGDRIFNVAINSHGDPILAGFDIARATNNVPGNIIYKQYTVTSTDHAIDIQMTGRVGVPTVTAMIITPVS